jgi:hypothetical protein
MARKPRARKENGQENGLTSIPPRIHCPATTDCVGGQDEINEVMVEHFLYTLAEVALAIASRKAAQAQQGGEVEL